MRHRAICAITVVWIMVVLGCASYAEPVVVGPDGKLYRNRYSINPVTEQPVVASTPCKYNTDHENVLSELIPIINNRSRGYQIKFFDTSARKAPNDQDISCGNCADTLRNAIIPVLPAGWKTFSVNSADPFNMFKSTSHTQFMVQAPDGTSYNMDAYFGDVEISKMRTERDGSFVPAEIPKTASYLHVALWGNRTYTWLRVSDVYTNPALKNDAKRTTISSWALVDKWSTDISLAFDPNDIYGPSGHGDQRYASDIDQMNFTVAFENLPAATLPAADVVVTNNLDPAKFDLSTFALGKIDFGPHSVTPHEGLSDYATDVDLRPAQDLIVRIVAHLDRDTGVVTWTFNTLDPATMLPPVDSTLGFLPPNVTAPEGEGHVRYTVTPKSGLTSGDKLTNKASIVFDVNAPLDTPEWFNTIDNVKPVGHVTALAATQGATLFDISWDGTDDLSGISKYTVYYSEDGGDYALFYSSETSGSRVFQGEKGKSYRFYCIATDAVGNVQDVPAAPDTQTTVSETADSLDISAGLLELVGETDAGGGLKDYVYRFKLTNNSSVGAGSVSAVLTSVPEGVSIIDGSLSFGDVAVDVSTYPSDTVTLRVNSPAKLTGMSNWDVTFQALGGPQKWYLDIPLRNPAVALPTVAITSPTTSSRNCPSLNIAGTATAEAGLSTVTWSNNRGGSGACTGGTTWEGGPITLAAGVNIITVSVTDSLSRTATAVLTATYVDSQPGTAWAGTAMVSLPIIPDTTDPKPVVGFDRSGWYAYDTAAVAYIPYSDHGSWFEPQSATPGRGFWAYFAEGGSASPCGTIPPQDAEAKIHLQAGWNLIGTPYITPVLWNLDDIQVEVGGVRSPLVSSGAVVGDYAWGWDNASNAYFLVYDTSILPAAHGSLEPWMGYWIKAKTACDLVLSAP